MIQLIKNYINDFANRAGSYVLVANIISRILSFFASWFALQFIDNQSLGVVLFAYNVILFIQPLAGLGLYQSLIRFGAIAETIEEKKQMFIYVFKKGIWACFAIILTIIISCSFINFDFEDTYFYVVLLSFIIIPTFLLEIIRAQLRLYHDNKKFAYSDITQNTILFSSVILLSYIFKEIGYAIALVATPTLTCLLFMNSVKINLRSKVSTTMYDFDFWKYGFFASLSSVVTQLLMIIDLLLIGYILKDTVLVTNYRYVSLLPYSLLFLPQVFIATDFVSFTENIKNKVYINKYIKSYVLLFSIVSVCIFIFCSLFAKQILQLFDDSLVPYQQTFMTLIIGIIGIYVTRGLFGNLLSSIGKVHINYYITSIALVLNIVLNFILIPKLGIQGAALTSAVLMWFTGIFSYVWFCYLYKRFLNE